MEVAARGPGRQFVLFQDGQDDDDRWKLPDGTVGSWSDFEAGWKPTVDDLVVQVCYTTDWKGVG